MPQIKLDSLNGPQREAATTLNGPLLVLAGAGTGKTMVITYRIACLLEAGIKPESLLAVTFTNKAAREMGERVARLLPHVNTKAMTISTFHSFSCRVLRQHISKLGYDKSFGIADDSDQDGIIREIVGHLNLPKTEQNTSQSFRAGISNAKNFLMTPSEVAESARHPWYQLLAQVYKDYQQTLKNMNLVDFDDLLFMVVQLWRDHNDVLLKYREKYTHILVDEFQDTNQVQAELIRLLAGQRKNVCVVGDDDQSIYGWRGADVSNILEFPQQYKGAKVVKLEQNYRSTNIILRVANHIISNNHKRHDKSLWSPKTEGDHLRVIECGDEVDEGGLIANLILELQVSGRYKFGDIAILYRSKYQSRALEKEMRTKRIPYRVVGSKSFYERREIKDAVGFMRLMHNPKDDLSFLRVLNVPPRGIGAKTIDSIRERKVLTKKPMFAVFRDMVKEQVLHGPAQSSGESFLATYDRYAAIFREAGDLAQHLHDYLVDIGYLNGLKKIYKDHEEAIQRQENILELLSVAARMDIERGPVVTLEQFLEENSLTDDNDRIKESEEEGYGITLMTVHASKGLEFPVVFIAGMEDKLFPHERSLAENGVDEERRLFYVAVTRAKETLFLTRAKARTRYHGKQQQRPSRFLEELPPDLVSFENQNEALRPATEEETAAMFAELMDRFSD